MSAPGPSGSRVANGSSSISSIYLPSSNKITVAGALTYSGQIDLSYGGNISTDSYYTFTSGFASYNSVSVSSKFSYTGRRILDWQNHEGILVNSSQVPTLKARYKTDLTGSEWSSWSTDTIDLYTVEVLNAQIELSAWVGDLDVTSVAKWSEIVISNASSTVNSGFSLSGKTITINGSSLNPTNSGAAREYTVRASLGFDSASTEKTVRFSIIKP